MGIENLLYIPADSLSKGHRDTLQYIYKPQLHFFDNIQHMIRKGMDYMDLGLLLVLELEEGVVVDYIL